MISRPSRGERVAARATFGFAVILICAWQLPTASFAQPRITEPKPLRIASWNLSDAVIAGAIVSEEPRRKSWRNTFGAERRVAQKPKFAGDRLQADVILLQGVRSIREARQIFPARDWKLILSRDVLKLGNGRLNRETTVEAERSITAVAVRYQRRLRVTRIEHLTDLGSERIDPSDTEASSSETVETDLSVPQVQKDEGPKSAELAGPPGRAQFPAALAIRLSFSGLVLWVVSGVLPPECRTGTDACQPATQLKEWADRKRADGLGVVMGGQFDVSLRQARTNSVCAEQEIIADKKLKAETGADTVAGCIVFADLDGA